MKWAIYYSDGSIYTYQDGNPEDAPVIGVQYIAQEDKNNNWVSLCNSDFYIWDKRDGVEKWYCASNAGRENYMRHPGWKKVLIGEWIGDLTYTAISKRVTDDIQVARKTGYAHWEWKPSDG